MRFQHSKYLALLVLMTTGASAQMQEMPPAQVEAVIVEAIPLAPSMQLKGNVISLQDAIVSSEVEGLLEDVLYVGTQVQKGQQVAQINQQKLEWQVQRAESVLAGLKADLEFRKNEVERFKTLSSRDNAAKNQLQQELTAQENIQQRIIAAQANVAEARRVLNDAQIKAPFAGVVAERFAHLGEFIRMGDPIVRLVNQSVKDISVPAPIRYQHLLASGMQVNLEHQKRVQQLPIRQVVAVGDPNSRMVEVRLDATDTDLIIGDSVTVNLPTAQPNVEVAIPRDAIVIRNNQPFIYLVGADSMAKQIPAPIKYAHGKWIVLNEGVNAGDKVIVRGAERLQPDSPVSVTLTEG